jgi:DNA polymerase sigma
LIVSFLNQDWADIYKRDGAISSAKALKAFLFYFGKLFDPNKSMVNEQQQIVPHMNFSSILIIQDPLNPSNNIGKSTFNFDTIRHRFAEAFETLHSHLQDFV